MTLSQTKRVRNYVVVALALLVALVAAFYLIRGYIRNQQDARNVQDSAESLLKGRDFDDSELDMLWNHRKRLTVVKKSVPDSATVTYPVSGFGTPSMDARTVRISKPDTTEARQVAQPEKDMSETRPDDPAEEE
jgi:hypothetical protein